jgi:hypothetical protein
MGTGWNRLVVLTVLGLMTLAYAPSDALAASLDSSSDSALGCQPRDQMRFARIWILAGQSQATTFGMNPNTVPASWKLDPGVHIWVSGPEPASSRWEVYRPGVNSAPRGQWGPELQLSARLRRGNPTTQLFLIKHAPGQTGAAFDPGENDWSPLSQGEAWTRLDGMVSAALKTCDGRVDAIFWMGNHSDGLRQEKAERVGANMKALIDLSRLEWGSQIKWVVGLPDDTAPYATTVQRELRALAASEPNVVIFETADYETQEDGLHYNTRSVHRLGDDFFETWTALTAGK